MGIFRAASGAVSGTLSDQWKEMYYCDSLDDGSLMVKGSIRTGKNSQNKSKNNVITDGSLICLADGQNAIIVENGKIIGLYTEPGENVYHSDLSKGVFSESGGVSGAAKDAWNRFTFGGDMPAYDQRVYYFNTKIILNRYFWADECPVRMVDESAGIAIDASVSISGNFSYRIVDPITFYKNHAGNQAYRYFSSEMDSYLKSMLVTYLQSSMSNIIGEGTRPSYALENIPQIREAIKSGMNAELVANSGIAIENVALDGFTIFNEDRRRIADMQRDAAYTNPSLAAAGILGAQTDAMRTAAANSGAAGLAMTAAVVKPGTAGLVSATAATNAGNAAGMKIKHKCSGCGQLTDDKFCQNCGTRNPEHP